LLKLRDGIVELLRKVATSLPSDVEEALRAAHDREREDGVPKAVISYILENIRLARRTSRPVCQDTGVPVFYAMVPKGLGHGEIRNTILEATRIATEKVPLRANAVDAITGKNSGDNTGIGFPVIHTSESPDGNLVVDLMLRGGGCENAGFTYSLPYEELDAEAGLEGVRRCVLDSVYRAQGTGCPPYAIGVGIGALKAQVARVSGEQLVRRIPDKNPVPELSSLEETLLEEINSLGIGPLGLGGKSTAMAVKIGFNHRHPTSYFVDVSLSCWALRRGRLIW
jgi:fumarate hydratase class I